MKEVSPRSENFAISQVIRSVRPTRELPSVVTTDLKDWYKISGVKTKSIYTGYLESAEGIEKNQASHKCPM